MAFHEIARGVFSGRKGLLNTVQVHSASKSPLTVSISKDIDAKIGNPMFVNVLLGSGEHSGFVALIPRGARGDASYKLGRPNNGSARFGISPQKIGVVGRKVAPTKLPFEITEDGLIVDIRPLRQPVLSAAA